jgi:hypothetical protein
MHKYRSRFSTASTMSANLCCGKRLTPQHTYEYHTDITLTLKKNGEEKNYPVERDSENCLACPICSYTSTGQTAIRKHFTKHCDDTSATSNTRQKRALVDDSEEKNTKRKIETGIFLFSTNRNQCLLL